MSDLNAKGRTAVFDMLGSQLITGKEYQFFVADKDMALQGQLDDNKLVAFQVWPGDGSTLFMSLRSNRIVSERTAGLMAVKMIIDWCEDQEELDSGAISDNLYDFLETDEGKALWEGN